MNNDERLTKIEAAGDSIISWRRCIHAKPELSFRETETAAFIEETLSSFGHLEISRPTPTSVLALLKGRTKGKSIAIRADIDALPVTEENESDFASRVPGVMHACGHDAHAAMLLGVAAGLSSSGIERGELRFLFQHAEEFFPGGASQIVASGALSGIDAVIGAHVMPTLGTGRFGIISGPAMAAPDEFSIEIRGRGGHGAMPQLSIDPIVVASEIVGALQTIVSRSIDPVENIVLSVTKLHSGTANNVIPDTASLGGTVRTFKEGVRTRAADLMDRVIKGICDAHGASYSFTYTRGYGAVDNDPGVTASVEKSIAAALGADSVVRVPPMMPGEDFSAYQALAPGCFFFVGTRNERKGSIYPNHHPRFSIDEDALPLGAKALGAAAIGLLENA
jgi:amidohydrolase